MGTTKGGTLLYFSSHPAPSYPVKWDETGLVPPKKRDEKGREFRTTLAPMRPNWAYPTSRWFFIFLFGKNPTKFQFLTEKGTRPAVKPLFESVRSPGSSRLRCRSSWRRFPWPMASVTYFIQTDWNKTLLYEYKSLQNNIYKYLNECRLFSTLLPSIVSLSSGFFQYFPRQIIFRRPLVSVLALAEGAIQVRQLVEALLAEGMTTGTDHGKSILI